MAAFAAELENMSGRMAGTLSRAMKGGIIARLTDSVPREVVDDIYSCALKKQTGELDCHLASALFWRAFACMAK